MVIAGMPIQFAMRKQWEKEMHKQLIDVLNTTEYNSEEEKQKVLKTVEKAWTVASETTKFKVFNPAAM